MGVSTRADASLSYASVGTQERFVEQAAWHSTTLRLLGRET